MTRQTGRQLGAATLYLARIPKADARPPGLPADGREQFLRYRWFSLQEIRSFPERIEPLQLLEIVADLARR
jgi:hypothetical protein